MVTTPSLPKTLLGENGQFGARFMSFMDSGPDMERNSVHMFVPTQPTHRPLRQALRPLCLALRPLWLALRPLWQAITPI